MMDVYLWFELVFPINKFNPIHINNMYLDYFNFLEKYDKNQMVYMF